MTLLTIDLRADAAAEAARLGAARALARPDDPEDSTDDVALAHLDGDAAWIMIARSPALRHALGGRALVLWRIGCEDASGRLLESRLVAVAVSLSNAATRLRRRSEIEALVRAMERASVETVDRCSDNWRMAVDRTTRAFATTRAGRARAIAMERRDAASSLFQPGLFDRRGTYGAHSTAAPSDAIAPADAITGRPRLRLIVVP